MVAYCAAEGCTNQYSPKCNLTYFRFPDPRKQPKLFEAWCKSLKKSNFKPKRTTGVCELHFSEDDYTDTYKLKRIFMPGEYFRPMLKPEAIPKLVVQNGETDGNKNEILGELLGESYLKWKNSIPEGRLNLQMDLDEVDLKIDPNALIIPSILKVIIKEEETIVEKCQKKQVNCFSCTIDLPRNMFYSCGQCSFTTFFKTFLMSHQRNVHQPILTKNQEQPINTFKFFVVKELNCQYCNFTTFSKLLFLKHRCQPNLFISGLFPERKIRNKQLSLVRELIHKDHSYTKQMFLNCEFCFYQTMRENSLRKHIRDNHRKAEYKFQCDKCNYKCIFANVFLKHLKKHGISVASERHLMEIFVAKDL